LRNIEVLLTSNNKYIAFDPGKTTGWATFNADGYLTLFGEIVGEDKLTDFLEELDFTPSVIIYEDYIINPHVRQGGKRPVASEAIGIIKSFARRKQIELVNQRNTVLDIGLKWAGLKRPKGHLPDKYSAIAHGTYYLESNNLRGDVLLHRLKQELES
jgi:hypothetical protein